MIVEMRDKSTLTQVLIFEGFMTKICYHIRIDWSQSNVHIFIPSDVSVVERSYDIWDDDNIEYVIVVVRSLQGSTKFYITKSCIEGKDNLQDEEVHEEEKEDYQHMTKHNYKVSKSMML